MLDNYSCCVKIDIDFLHWSISVNENLCFISIFDRVNSSPVRSVIVFVYLVQVQLQRQETNSKQTDRIKEHLVIAVARPITGQKYDNKEGMMIVSSMSGNEADFATAGIG